MTDKHLSTQFDAELSGISNRVLEMGGLVESQVAQALHALTHFSAETANQVLQQEERVNQMEIEIDRDLSAIIARRQPTARDLRLLIAVSKAIANLELHVKSCAGCNQPGRIDSVEVRLFESCPRK